MKLSVITAIYVDDDEVMEIAGKLYFEGIKQQGGREVELILIDDCSPKRDDVEKLVKKERRGLERKFERVVFVRNQENLGYTKTLNKGIGMARGKVLGFVTQDVYVPKGVMERMYQVLVMNKRVGVVGPVGNNVWSRQRLSGIPPLRNYRRSERMRWERLAKRVRGYGLDSLKTEFLQGHCYVVKREVFEELGVFDEDLGKMYCEDMEFMDRIRGKYEAWIDRGSLVCHGGVEGREGWWRWVRKMRKNGVGGLVATLKFVKRRSVWGVRMLLALIWWRCVPGAGCDRYYHNLLR